MAKDLFFIPLGGSGGGGFDPTQYYTRDQIDALIADFVTASTNSLINYYLKSETYSQTEVNSLISAIETTHFEVYASLSDITNPQSNVLYLVGPIGTGSDKYEIYIYSNNQFVKIDDTSIDLSGYATTTDLQNAINTAMATLQQYTVDNFYQKSEVDAMIAQVQTLQGIQGIAGQNGTNGEQGIQGIKGTDGTNGVQGIQGIAGQNGTNGVDGSQGIQGIAGQNGSNGEQGIQGIKGTDGVNGLQGIQGPAGGGGGNAWYGTQAEFDALQSPSADVDYYISDQIKWDEIKWRPDIGSLATKNELNQEVIALDELVGKKENKIQYMSMQGFQSIQPQEGYVYAIEGSTVEMVFTFTDSTQATYNVVVD